jgi:L-threonylcarbamoyladenylate synthase
LLALVSGFEMAFRHAEPPQGPCREILLEHWPGPLTAVLRARSHVPPDFCGPGDTLAFRWPSSPFLQALVGALGVPLLSTSANHTGAPTPVGFEEVKTLFPHGVDAFVDGGDLAGEASTVVDLTGPEPVVIRPGTLVL